MSKVLDNKTAIGRRIAECREALGLSQGALAKRMELSRGAPGQWEAGFAEPSKNHLRALAEIFSVSLEWLTTGQGSRTPPIFAPRTLTLKSEGELIALDDISGDLGRSLKAIVAGRKLDVYRLSTDNLSGAGYHPGNYLFVDTQATPKARDIVLAFVGSTPIFRAFFPPYLYALLPPPGVQPEVLRVDNVRVLIKGVIVSRFSE